MNWDAVGAIGEIIGAVAVLATLYYLAAQIKMQNRELEKSNKNVTAQLSFDINNCSGQVILATSLWLIQYFCSDSFGDNPPLC